MIIFTALYPYGKDKRFDMDYYLTRHVEAIKHGLGDKLRGLSVDKGLSGFGPGTDPAYFVILRVALTSPADLDLISAMAPQLLADIPNYTDTEPVFQMSEVME
jgi:uncharacterized protein (TIGR02118 family)